MFLNLQFTFNIQYFTKYSKFEKKKKKEKLIRAKNLLIVEFSKKLSITSLFYLEYNKSHVRVIAAGIEVFCLKALITRYNPRDTKAHFHCILHPNLPVRNKTWKYRLTLIINPFHNQLLTS